MNVLCVGFGFVGKAYALLLRELGYEVDVVTAQDNTYNEATKYGFSTTTFIPGGNFDVVVIAVPTPTVMGEQDLTILASVLKELSQQNKKIPNIIIKSTVLPLEIIELEDMYKLPNQRFILYPEFLEAKNPIGGAFNQSCKVFGKSGKWGIEDKKFITKLFGFKKEEITLTTLSTASMLKYIHNMWLSCNISFWNAMMRCTEQFDIDYELILKETHKSKYFGTHPWHIGTGYGGACLPKDIKAFISSIEKGSKFLEFIKMIDTVNNNLPQTKEVKK